MVAHANVLQLFSKAWQAVPSALPSSAECLAVLQQAWLVLLAKVFLKSFCPFANTASNVDRPFLAIVTCTLGVLHDREDLSAVAWWYSGYLDDFDTGSDFMA